MISRPLKALMIPTRIDLETDLARLMASINGYERAVGENFSMEEYVKAERSQDFEAFSAISDLRELADEYFRGSVQGNVRGHASSTFSQLLNERALLPATLEQTQKIVRLERIDRMISTDPALEFRRLSDALKSKDTDVLSAFVALFDAYPGERPAFVTFKAEVADDLKHPDWLDRMIRRRAGQLSEELVPFLVRVDGLNEEFAWLHGM